MFRIGSTFASPIWRPNTLCARREIFYRTAQKSIGKQTARVGSFNLIDCVAQWSWRRALRVIDLKFLTEQRAESAPTCFAMRARARHLSLRNCLKRPASQCRLPGERKCANPLANNGELESWCASDSSALNGGRRAASAVFLLMRRRRPVESNGARARASRPDSRPILAILFESRV